MQSRSLFLIVCVLAGVPVLAFAFLASTGLLAPGPALLAMALTGVSSFLIAVLWARDLELLSETVQQAIAQEIAPDALRSSVVRPAPSQAAPALPPMERLMRDVMFEVPSSVTAGTVTITGATVRGESAPLVCAKSVAKAA